MHVLHVTRDFPPRQNGGLSTAVAGLVEALRIREIGGTVISFDGWRPSKGTHVPTPTPPPEDAPFGKLFRIVSGAACPCATDVKESIDAVHVHDAMLWPAGAELARELDVPAVYTVHSLHAHAQKLRGIDAETQSRVAEARAVGEADAVTVAFSRMRELLSRYYSEASASVAVASFGVHPSAEADKAVEQERPELGLYVGRFAELKGTEDLMSIVKRVLGARFSARFRVVGGIPENPRGDKRWREEWFRVAESVGGGRVELEGWVPSHSLGEHWRNARVSLVPSWFETFGQSALESMHWGTPVIASRVGGLMELVEDGHTGLLCEPRTEASWVEALEQVLRTPRRGATLGRAAAQYVREQWMWSMRVGEWIALYRRL